MYGFGTRVVHGGSSSNDNKISKSVDLNFYKDEISGIDNKSKTQLEKCIASLEHAKYAICFPSGTAAVTSITHMLKTGDHVVIFDSVYHGTRTYFSIRDQLGDIGVTFADLQDPCNLEKLLQTNTKMVWIESPSNPIMKLVDIELTAEIIRKHTEAIFVVDNTFMTPYYQNPLLLGADIVMHSLTKYMNGHEDVMMGAAATNSEQLHKKMMESVKLIGSTPSPWDCCLVLREMQTLHLRMERHMENAMQIAQFLQTHPNVEKVNYPGLKNHPQHALALKQCRGFSGMLSFCVKGGTEEVKKIASKIKVFTLAGSLGSAESKLDITSLMTAKKLSKEKKEKMEITDNLIRLSVGLESAKDLIADLDQALRF